MTRSTQTLDQFNMYQMLQVLSYQFVDKTKQMGGKRSFHFIANCYNAQSKFHPKAPAAEYRTRKKGKKRRMTWLLASSKFVYPRRIPLTRPETSSLYRPSLTTIATILATLSPRLARDTKNRRWKITWNRSTWDNAGSGIDSVSEIQSRSLSYRLAAGISNNKIAGCTECMRASNSRYALETRARKL